MHRHSWTLLVLGLGTAALGACKKAPPPPPPSEATTPPEPPAPPPFAVKTIDVGKGITADKHVANSTTTFGVRDTIYASVLTDGAAPSKTVSAKWTFHTGQVVQEQNETFAATGPAATEFHISKKSPWPVGKYKVEISVDGSPAGSKDFEVKK
jgi:hypothetical protein